MLLSSRDGLKYCRSRPSRLTWGSSRRRRRRRRRRRTYLHIGRDVVARFN